MVGIFITEYIHVQFKYLTVEENLLFVVMLVESNNDSFEKSVAVVDIDSASSVTEIREIHSKICTIQQKNYVLLVFENRSLCFASCIDGKSLGLNEFIRLKGLEVV